LVRITPRVDDFDLYRDIHDGNFQGGGAISFLMQLEGFSFRKAAYELSRINKRWKKQNVENIETNCANSLGSLGDLAIEGIEFVRKLEKTAEAVDVPQRITQPQTTRSKESERARLLEDRRRYQELLPDTYGRMKEQIQERISVINKKLKEVQ
jgi:hypothetical protein